MKRLLLFFVYPIAQITIILIAGYLALNIAAPSDVTRGGVWYSGVEFAGMNTAEASAIVGEIGGNNMENGYAVFTYGGTRYLFHFSEIDLTADYSRIETSLSAKDSPLYINNLLTLFLRNYSAAPKPEYSADPAAFLTKLKDMKSFIDATPINADIEYTKDGELRLSHSKNGVYFDIDNQFDIIFSEFLADPFKIIALDANAAITESALITVEPLVTDAYLSGIDTVLAHIQAPIPPDYDMSLVSSVAEAINKVWAPKKGTAYAPFSFLRYIDQAGLPTDKASLEYNLAASALLHALLVSGVDYAKTEAVISEDENAYAELPGFGVELISGNAVGLSGDGPSAGQTAQDFNFTNTLDGNIVIFAYSADGYLNIVVAGKKELSGAKAAPYEINSEVQDGHISLYRNGKKIADYSQ